MRSRFTTRLLAGLTLTAGLTQTAAAAPPAPTVEEFARSQPIIPGVAVSYPKPDELARCRVETVSDGGKPIGYALVDANGKQTRRFLAVKSETFNIRSFFLDGNEVYRETDSNGNGKPDQFRWLGVNGSKWGLDAQETGRVTSWPVISAEEVSKEVFEAIVANDPKRVEALLPTAAELAEIGLPPSEVTKVQQRTAGAAARVTATAAAMKLTPQAKWVHVELGTPQTTPAELFGGKMDIVRHRTAGVLVDKGDGKTAEFFQTGELVLFKSGWRLIDGPSPGAADPGGGATTSDAGNPVVPEAIRELVKKLSDIKEPPAGSNPAEYAKFHAERAAILEQIVAKLQGDPAQETWLRQCIDAHTAATENGDKASGERLIAWKKTIDGSAPKSAMAAFVGFKALAVEYRSKMAAAGANTKQVADTQTWWKDSLDTFTKAFPNVDETAEALYQLGLANDFGDRRTEASARDAYATLAKNFPQHQLAGLAQGAVRRLDSEGAPFQLVGQTLNGQQVNVGALQGKPTLVYYWASWSGELKSHAEFLADVVKQTKGGVNIVTVCMDADPQTAAKSINAVQLPGVHLYQQGGALATAYGIMGPHLFLIGKDGKVANKNADIPGVTNEIEKMLK